MFNAPALTANSEHAILFTLATKDATDASEAAAQDSTPARHVWTRLLSHIAQLRVLNLRAI
ncbi:MAG: hypothetical protein AAF382_04890 [Pseudomonadota bacterium]